MAIAAAPERASYWVVPVVRGILALVPAAAITFSQNHSPEFGLLVFGLWAVVSGLVTGALSMRFTEDRGIRSFFVIAAVVTVAAGLLALTVPGGLPFLLYLVSVWAAVTGILELFAGLRARGRTPPPVIGSPPAHSPRSSRSCSSSSRSTPSPRSACSAATSSSSASTS